VVDDAGLGREHRMREDHLFVLLQLVHMMQIAGMYDFLDVVGLIVEIHFVVEVPVVASFAEIERELAVYCIVEYKKC